MAEGVIGIATSNANDAAAYAPGWGAAAVHWGLSGMGLAVLAACILLPELRDCKSLADEAAWHQEQARILEEQIADQRRTLRQIREPAVVARMARRELGYRLINETVITVPVERASGIPSGYAHESYVELRPRTAFSPAQPEAAQGSLLQRYDAAFYDEEARTLLIVLSVAVLACGFVAFHGRSTP